jgi:peptidoglycan/LPS O-acetylase OafA/YrhL
MTGAFLHHRYWVGLWLVLAIAYDLIRQPYFMGWFINPSYSFYFIAGVCAFLISKNNSDVFSKLCFFVSMSFGVAVAGDHVKNFVSQQDAAFMFHVRIVVAAFFMFFYALAHGFFNIKKPPKWWVYLGAISYPLYLMHNRAGKVLIESFESSVNVYVLVMIVFICVSIVSLAIHILVERPINLFAGNGQRLSSR